ncbi:pyruvate kinase [Candidatus Woesebacteria bacterium]|nr:pyruvate kinase [Candidatus Woesebacteria bacterium]
MKSTKIVATIGPATETEETIGKLIDAGMNVARFNTKHSTPEWHRERMLRVRKVAREKGVAVGILLDLQGPEIRINTPHQTVFQVEEGDSVAVLPDGTEFDGEEALFIPKVVVDALQIDSHVLIDDGLGEFIVTDKDAHSVTITALSSFPVSHRKTLNTPGTNINMPSLIEADFAQLEGLDPTLIDFVGLSFVRDEHDIAVLRSELEKRNITAQVVAKIENQKAIDNIESIVVATDVVMIARGDLAVEVPFEQLTHWQKVIIQLCRVHARPVIVATQMLKSMVENPRPTRAEVSDVANAVYDGTDAIMLSEETTIGRYPVKAVKTQSQIASYNEQFVEPQQLNVRKRSTAAYITEYAVKILEESRKPENTLRIDHIVVLTESGKTARLLTRYRPHQTVHVLTSTQSTYDKLSVQYGVTPHKIVLPNNEQLESSHDLILLFESLGIAAKGESIMLVHGTHWKIPGLTNTLSVLTVPEKDTHV